MDSRRLRLTEHALVQLGRRYGLAPSRAELRSMLAQAVPLFDIPSGTVYGMPADDMLTFPVVRQQAVVTVITQEMAFADCPQAVFHYMIREGWLMRALALRAAWQAGRLPSAATTAAAHPNDGIVWSAFASPMSRKLRR